jgi:NAD(P)H-hydrate epimerase
MRAVEEAAFRGGVVAEELMEKVGARMAAELRRRFPRPGVAVGFIGKGNNGGDALVVLRHLAAAGWEIALRCGYPEIDLGVLPRRMLRRLGPLACAERVAAPGVRPLLVLDGLLGIGGSGGLRAPLAELAGEINELGGRGGYVVALDLPSGIDADTGECPPGSVRADLTLTVGLVKVGLLDERAVSNVGRLGLIALDELPLAAATGERSLICPEELAGVLGRRDFDFHKGLAGRLAIVAGSAGLEGAAALAATGGVRGGAGLVSLFFTGGSASLLARSLPVEVMVRGTRDAERILASKPDALALGPGFGDDPDECAGLLRLLEMAAVPVVLDADGLTAVARHGRHDLLRANVVVTPHPGEMRRLLADADGLGREATVRRFVAAHRCVLLYKGARTLVAQRGTGIWHNPTGTPGMAGGGQGDLLTGVIGALLAQGLAPFDGARLGAWLCGRAAERAEELDGESHETLTATATAARLAAAFNDWRSHR